MYDTRWLPLVIVLGCARSAVTPVEPTTQAKVVAEPELESAKLYSPDEAVYDILSGPLQFIGRGQWHNMGKKFQACAYHNDKVVVVDVYCAKKEPTVFGLRVFSPSRGRVVLYAEADGQIARARRDDYIVWQIESHPPPADGAVDPPLALTTTFPDLLAYATARYKLFIPGCFREGRQPSRTEKMAPAPKSGCRQEIEKLQPEWDQVSEEFWLAPPDRWYEAMAEVRKLARINGI